MLLILVLLLLAVSLVAVPAFLYLRWPMALALSAVLPPVLFQGANWVHLGYLDPFWPIALAVSTAVCLVLAAGVGLLVVRWSRNR
ncbi:MAG: hypothetical protein HEQ37_17820 [Acidovorax sp.]|nr:hypothetical protein [Acidovorax sp.]MDH4448246.1 hypothetical protein [Acidovorax sp.]